MAAQYYRVHFVNIAAVVNYFPFYCGAGRKFVHPVNATYKSSFAATGGPYNGYYLVFANVHVYALQYPVSTEGGAEVSRHQYSATGIYIFSFVLHGYSRGLV